MGLYTPYTAGEVLTENPIAVPENPDLISSSAGKVLLTKEHFHNEIREVTDEYRPVIKALCAHYRPRIMEVTNFLRDNSINRHSIKHQSRDAGMLGAIGHAFQTQDDKEGRGELTDKMIEIVKLSAFGHDSLGYEPDAHRAADGGWQPGIVKHTLDYHPVRSARTMMEILGFDDPELARQLSEEELDPKHPCPIAEIKLPPKEILDAIRAKTADWTDDDKRLAINAARFHSNGSAFEQAIQSGEKIPLAALLLRMADKLDMESRTYLDQIKPNIRKEEEMTYWHRLVPASIRDTSYEIDFGRNVFRVIYDVNLSIVDGIVKGGYSAGEFMSNFQSAYNGAMERAATVAHQLFEHRLGQKFDDTKQFLEVEVRFSDGHSQFLPYAPHKESRRAQKAA